jgi:pyrimidine-specific ribonucleoside hydrolase
MTSIKKVIIDTDVDFDDYMAMVYLLQHPNIEVVAISVTGCGASHLSHGVANVANLLTLFDANIQQTPVLRGAKAPLRYSNVFDQAVRTGANLHYDAVFPGVNPTPNIHDAQPWLTDFFCTTTEPVTLLSIGGGTNFGTLFQSAASNPTLDAGIKRSLEDIVMMGGNLLPEYVKPGAGGNIIDALGNDVYYTNKVAEWNIFIDPLGAKLMFDYGINITLVALNATNEVPIDQPFVDMVNAIDTPQGRFISQVLEYPSNKSGIGTFLSFWDPLAACVLVMPGLITTEAFNITVYQELDEETDETAKLIVDNTNGSRINVALDADKDAVYAEYLRVLAL